MRTWDNAFLDVAELNSSGTMNGNSCDDYIATFTDWRLPNVRELVSLIDYEMSDSPLLPTPNPFMNFQSSFYQSSTTFAPLPGSAWAVDFDFGFVGNINKDGGFVLPVRGGS